jgi:hypothetical protein
MWQVMFTRMPAVSTIQSFSRCLLKGAAGLGLLRVHGYAGLPFGGIGILNAYTAGVYGCGDGHVFDFEFVDGFDTQVCDAEDAAAPPTAMR